MTATTHTMPIDLHLDDTGRRLALRDQITALRRDQYPAVAAYAKRLGVTRKAVDADERCPCPNPSCTIVQQRLRPLHHRLAATPVGLPPPDPDDPAPAVWATAAAAATDPGRRDGADLAHLIATLTAIRTGAGIGQRRLAAAFGRRHQSAISYIEKVPAGLWLSTAQRYTRALGLALGVDGWLDVRLEPSP